MENGNERLEESEKDEMFSIEELKNIYTTKHADEDRLFREEMKVRITYATNY